MDNGLLTSNLMETNSQEGKPEVKQDIIEFLCGSGEYDGYWWGDNTLDKRPPFWWRSKLREHLASLQSEVSSLRAEKDKLAEWIKIQDETLKNYTKVVLKRDAENATLKSDIKEKTEWLEAYKKSNHLLHEAMISAEMRGVEKGREEMKVENERLKEELSKDEKQDS